MALISKESLVRSSIFLECAFAAVDEVYEPPVQTSDIIGMAAWSFGGWMDRDLFERTVKGFFGESIFSRIEYAKDLFNYEGGLWNFGPAVDDVRFLHPLLIDFYPHVNARADGALNLCTRGKEWGNVNL